MWFVEGFASGGLVFYLWMEAFEQVGRINDIGVTLDSHSVAPPSALVVIVNPHQLLSPYALSLSTLR